VNTNWELILGIVGAATGLLASLRWVIKDIGNIVSRPVLKLSKSVDVKNWNLADIAETRRFITIEVTNNRRQTAQRCVAIATVVKQPSGVTLLQKTFPLHWAGIPYSVLTTGAEPVDIGMEPRRLDVAFTTHNDTDKAWIAMPFALSAPSKVRQAVLPKGEYVLKIQVSCSNGKGDSKLLKLLSPSNWQDLSAEQI
jgi:hypothetical protein